MEFLAKAAHYAGTAISGLVISFFFLLGNLLGPRRPGSGPSETLVLLVAGAVGYGLLALAIRLGHQQQHWLAGLGAAVGAVVVAGTVMFFGLLLFGKVHWQ